MIYRKERFLSDGGYKLLTVQDALGVVDGKRAYR